MRRSLVDYGACEWIAAFNRLDRSGRLSQREANAILDQIAVMIDAERETKVEHLADRARDRRRR